MNVDRMIRVNALLRREIGEALFRIMTEEDFDLGAVTITHVITSRNLQHARVLVSIRDHEEDRERMLRVLHRHRVEIQSLINRDIGLKFTPRLQFEIDTSVEHGDRILTLLNKLAPEDGHEP